MHNKLGGRIMQSKETVLYKRVGRKYQRVGLEFTGFPANGVWLVKDGHNSLIVPLEYPHPIERAQLGIHREAVVEALQKKLDGLKKPLTLHDLVDHVMDTLVYENKNRLEVNLCQIK